MGTTQVVLFTHHDHIADMARPHAGVAILAMPTADPQCDHVVAVQELAEIMRSA